MNVCCTVLLVVCSDLLLCVFEHEDKVIIRPYACSHDPVIKHHLSWINTSTNTQHVTKQPKFQRRWHMFAVGTKSGEFALSSGNEKGLRSRLHFHNCTNATWHGETNKAASLPNMFSLPPYCKWRIEMRLYERLISRWLSLCPIPTCPIPRYQTTYNYNVCVWENGMCLCKQQGMKQKKGAVLFGWGRRCGRLASFSPSTGRYRSAGLTSFIFLPLHDSLGILK